MLVGRDAQLTVGNAAVTDALAGHGGLVLLTGEAGIGKSALAHAIAERARADGALVRVGACWDTDGLPAFTPWLDALRRPAGGPCAAVAVHLAAGDDLVTDAASASRARARLFAEVADALYEVSADQPQVILLEDLHWADTPSLALLGALAPHLRSMPVLVVGTYRDDELRRPSPLSSLAGAAERVALEGLDAGAVAEIVASVTGARPAGGTAAALQARTGGNPLFVTQMARLLDAGSASLPSGVQEVLERRLARVSSDAAHVLGAAAVLGHEFDQSVLAALVGDDVAPALDEARAARLVEPCAGEPMRWRFVHALVQTTRYDTLATTEREAWHRSAVDALGGRASTSAAELAHHAVRARFDPDDATPAQLHAAAGAEALTRLAWEDAIAAFGRALEAAPAGTAGDVVRAEAWLGIGAARLRLDRSDVRQAFDEAVALAEALDRPDLLARAALGFGIGLGAFEVRLLDQRQIEVLEAAAAALPEDHPLLPLVLARLSVALAFVESAERREELASRAVELARARRDAVVVGHALAARCDVRSGPAHVDERAAAAREIIGLAQRSSDLPLELLGRRLLVVALLEKLDFAGVDAEITAYASAAHALGDAVYSWYVPLWRGMRAWQRGEVDAAHRLLREAIDVGMGGGSQNAVVLGSVAQLMVAIDARDRAGAEAAMTVMIEAVPNLLLPYVWLTQALVASRLGALEEARASVAHVSPADVEGLPRDSEWMGALTLVSTAAGLLGDPERAAFVRPLLLEHVGVGAVEGIGAYLHGSPHRYLGLVSAVLGDLDAVRAHVAGAEHATAGGGALLERLTDLDAARALSRVGEAEAATRHAARARTCFERLGLVALAEEAAELEGRDGSSAGSPAGRSAPEPAPTLARQGDAWAVSWAGGLVHVKHAKGVADLAVLLERPGREVHVRELEGTSGPPATTQQVALDETAVRQYRQRLTDLEEDLDEAERHGDGERAAVLAIERDALVDQLTTAFGLARQGRRLGSDPDERLRKAVSARIKASIDRLDGLDPALGRHLRASVRTGFWCSYAPERPVAWTVRR
ncbi:MAG: ATP-binding protein [Acidimicrobiales bacterium]